MRSLLHALVFHTLEEGLPPQAFFPVFSPSLVRSGPQVHTALSDMSFSSLGMSSCLPVSAAFHLSCDLTPGPRSCYRVMATYIRPLSLFCQFSHSLGNAGLGHYRFFLWFSTFQCSGPHGLLAECSTAPCHNQTSSELEGPMSNLRICPNPRSRAPILIQSEFRS